MRTKKAKFVLPVGSILLGWLNPLPVFSDGVKFSVETSTDVAAEAAISPSRVTKHFCDKLIFWQYKKNFLCTIRLCHF